MNIEIKNKNIVDNPNPDLRYEIGSQTKMFTSTLIFKLIEGDKISLDTIVSDVLDVDLTFKHDETNKEYDASKYTIKELLSHKVKVPDYVNWGKAMPDEKIFNRLIEINKDKYTFEDIKELIQKENKQTEEEIEATQYSNVGYYILGLVIEKLYNNSFDKVLLKEIFTPLKMNDSRVDNSDLKGHFNGESSTFPLSLYFSAGAITSTANDMKKFISIFTNGDESVILNKTKDIIKDLASQNRYGVGFMYLNKLLEGQLQFEVDFFGHGGQTLSYSSGTYFNVDTKEIVTLSSDDSVVVIILEMIKNQILKPIKN